MGRVRQFLAPKQSTGVPVPVETGCRTRLPRPLATSPPRLSPGALRAGTAAPVPVAAGCVWAVFRRLQSAYRAYYSVIRCATGRHRSVLLLDTRRQTPTGMRKGSVCSRAYTRSAMRLTAYVVDWQRESTPVVVCRASQPAAFRCGETAPPGVQMAMNVEEMRWGIDAGEAGGSEPPRRLSGGRCRAYCMAQCRAM